MHELGSLGPLYYLVKLHSSEINICSDKTRPADWPDVVITDEF